MSVSIFCAGARNDNRTPRQPAPKTRWLPHVLYIRAALGPNTHSLLYFHPARRRLAPALVGAVRVSWQPGAGMGPTVLCAEPSFLASAATWPRRHVLVLLDVPTRQGRRPNARNSAEENPHSPCPSCYPLYWCRNLREILEGSHVLSGRSGSNLQSMPSTCLLHNATLQALY